MIHTLLVCVIRFYFNYYMILRVRQGLIIMGIIVQRQISRNRNNSARRDPQVNFKVSVKQL